MWGVTRDAAVSLNRGVFVNKRSLFVCVTLDTGCIGPRRQSRLFELETAVRIVTVAALHRAFQHFVMERQIELMLGLSMTTQTKLWFAFPEQL